MFYNFLLLRKAPCALHDRIYNKIGLLRLFAFTSSCWAKKRRAESRSHRISTMDASSSRAAFFIAFILAGFMLNVMMMNQAFLRKHFHLVNMKEPDYLLLPSLRKDIGLVIHTAKQQSPLVQVQGAVTGIILSSLFGWSIVRPEALQWKGASQILALRKLGKLSSCRKDWRAVVLSPQALTEMGRNKNYRPNVGYTLFKNLMDEVRRQISIEDERLGKLCIHISPDFRINPSSLMYWSMMEHIPMGMYEKVGQELKSVVLPPPRGVVASAFYFQAKKITCVPCASGIMRLKGRGARITAKLLRYVSRQHENIPVELVSTKTTVDFSREVCKYMHSSKCTAVPYGTTLATIHGILSGEVIVLGCNDASRLAALLAQSKAAIYVSPSILRSSRALEALIPKPMRSADASSELQTSLFRCIEVGEDGRSSSSSAVREVSCDVSSAGK